MRWLALTSPPAPLLYANLHGECAPPRPPPPPPPLPPPSPPPPPIPTRCGPPPMLKFACRPNLDKLGHAEDHVLAF